MKKYGVESDGRRMTVFPNNRVGMLGLNAIFQY